MSETKTIYETAETIAEALRYPVLCENCKEVIGYIVDHDGIPALTVGGCAVRKLHGWCGICGADIAWESGDKIFERLINRIESRKKTVEI